MPPARMYMDTERVYTTERDAHKESRAKLFVFNQKLETVWCSVYAHIYMYIMNIVQLCPVAVRFNGKLTVRSITRSHSYRIHATLYIIAVQTILQLFVMK